MKKYIAVAAMIVVIMMTLASFSSDEPANKAALGRLLFFDTMLSKDSSISCAICHKPAFPFADTLDRAKGDKQGQHSCTTAGLNRTGKN